MATRTTQRVNSRAAEEQVQLQAQSRAQALTSGNTRLSGGDQDAGGSMAKVAQFDSQGNMLRNSDGSPVTTRVSVSGPIVPSTAGGTAALERLNAVAGGARINQAGVQGAQQLAQSSELQDNLNRLQPGANGQIGQLGYNPVNTTLNNAIDTNPSNNPSNKVGSGISPYFEPLDFTTGSNVNLSQQEQEALTTERLAQAQIKENIRSTQQQNVARDAAAKAQASGRQVRRTVTTSALDAVIASLPPEDQAVANAYREVKSAREDAMDIAKQNFREGQEIIDENYTDEQSMIADMRNKAIDDFNVVEDMLSDQRDRNEKMLAEKEEQATQQLSFLETKLVRDAGKQKRSMLDKSIASLALSGGFGSSNGNESIVQAEQAADDAIADLQKEFGFKRADIALSFKESYNQAQEKYEVGFMEAWQAYQNKDDSLGLRALTSTQQKKKDKQANLETLRTTVVGLKQQMATDVVTAAKDVRTMVLSTKAEKQKNESNALEELKWYREMYGANPPQGVIDDLAKRLPNTNVRSFFETKTADEAEKQAKKTGGSSGGARSKFNPNDFKSGGIEPTQEDYVNKKLSEAGFLKTPDYSAEIAAEEERLGMTMDQQERDRFVSSLDSSRSELEQLERAKLQSEWSAKKSSSSLTDPNSMRDELIDRVSGSDVAKHTRENAIEQFDSLIQRGEYDKARDFIDGLGKSPVQTERKQYQAARQAKQDVFRIKAVLDKIGEQGPIVGRFREMNPYDDRVVELNNLITSTVPNLARGVFGEVGVLTDVDVARYTNIIANVELTKTQAETATRNLLITIDNNVRAQLDIHRASGLDVRDLEAIFFDGASAERNDEAIDEILNSVYQ